MYLDLSTIDYLCGMFASKRAEGRVIVNFLNPFELEKVLHRMRICHVP